MGRVQRVGMVDGVGEVGGCMECLDGEVDSL